MRDIKKTKYSIIHDMTEQIKTRVNRKWEGWGWERKRCRQKEWHVQMSRQERTQRTLEEVEVG